MFRRVWGLRMSVWQRLRAEGSRAMSKADSTRPSVGRAAICFRLLHSDSGATTPKSPIP